MLKKLSLICSTALLVGCANPAANYAANVYDSSQINTRQEAKAVTILSLEPSKVKVDNSKNQSTAAIFGALLGGLAGAGESSDHALVGALAGGLIGDTIAGSDVLVDGVSIFYQDNGKILTSTQVGHMCEFSQGLAMVVISEKDSSRIQPNSATPCIKDSEHIAGQISKYQNTVGDGQMLQLSKQRSYSDKLSDLDRQKELLHATTAVQKEITELTKEETRSLTASEQARLELERAKAEIDSLKADNEATRSISKGLGEGLSRIDNINIKN